MTTKWNYIHKFYDRILVIVRQWRYFYDWLSLTIKLGMSTDLEQGLAWNFYKQVYFVVRKLVDLLDTHKVISTLYWTFHTVDLISQFYRCFEEFGIFDVKGQSDCCRTNNEKCDWIILKSFFSYRRRVI